MISFDFDKHCVGCAACSDVCGHGCITIVEDKYGFRIPYVDTSRCVECGMCNKVCPVLNVNIRPNKNQKCYCTYHLDEEIRYMGSSGSMFYLIAEWMLTQGGIVFGAAFDEQLKLRHIEATTLQELRPLMKSKYLQSDTTGVFKKVRDYLIKGQRVLFVGTPCQCQALYNFTNERQKENLILVDFICHGVPSQHLFDRFIRNYENKKKVKVKSFIFREKKTPKPPRYEDDIHNFTIETIDHYGHVSTKTGFYRDCSFYQGFKKYQIFRNSCYECKFVGKDRITDFTLGDFWYLTEYELEIKDFHKGYSELIVNSERGSALFDSLRGKVYCKEYSMDVPLKRNYAYSRPTIRYIDRELFSFFYSLPYGILSLIWSRNIFVRGSIYFIRRMCDKLIICKR